MLNKSKVFIEMQLMQDKIFTVNNSILNDALEAWNAFLNNNKIQNEVLTLRNIYDFPLWISDPNLSFECKKMEKIYSILAIDGSQIYPDKHQGNMCSLLNVGFSFFSYEIENSKVVFSSEPFFSHAFNEDLNELSFIDLINIKREILEIKKGVEHLIENKELFKPTILLFDGALIFWPVLSKNENLVNKFIKEYESILQLAFDNKITMAWYSSAPNNKELMSIVKLLLKNDSSNDLDDFNKINDINLLGQNLSFGHRSAIFKSYHDRYCNDENLNAYFFYFNVGSEIVRIEIPGYLANNFIEIDNLCSIILDQVSKGQGYPIALSEAHCQAVIQACDRDFFYFLIEKIGISKNKKNLMSQKNIKKKIMAI